ncbi:hypothetical protein [Capnocytophaga canimorsus]|uniref:hypothetical protein n=1 Tax=Capnocytophaga canimorsus TaxID=28188 RepID=UPI0037D35BB9
MREIVSFLTSLKMTMTENTRIGASPNWLKVENARIGASPNWSKVENTRFEVSPN